LWLQAVYGRYFAAKLDIPSYIDFGDKPYLYSDPAQYDGELNFWNYYYIQHLSKNDTTRVFSEFIETYPLRIWKRSHFRKVFSLAVKDLVLRKSAKQYIGVITAQCRKYKTLGVHIRGTDHSEEVQEVPLGRYLRLLRKNLSKYQKFFIATDDNRALKQIIKEFGEDRLILQEAVRSDNDQAVHSDMQHSNRYRLGLEVLTDCYALSACDEVVLVHSNVSYCALMINPRLKYQLLETKVSRRSRQKTGLLYTLDHWGIRRM
jgi:hypothetical protein